MSTQLIQLGSGKCSSFGGPNDTGVGNQEGLSCIDNSDLQEWWFRRIFVEPDNWDNNKGLVRNLNPVAFYCAMRWGYGSFNGVQGEILQEFTRETIRRSLFIIEANAKKVYAQAADWGPNTDTGRLIDLSPGICHALGVSTDDKVSVSVLF